MKIEIKHTVLGTHQWSNCPHEDVSFLRNEHHHDFTIRVSTEVVHDDRDIEFIMLRIDLMQILATTFINQNYIVKFENRSCEMISNDIRKELIKRYKGNYDFKVSVSEDETYRGGDW